MVNSQVKKTKRKTGAHAAKSKTIAVRKPVAKKTAPLKATAKKTTTKKAVASPKKATAVKKAAKPASKAVPKPARAQRPAGMPEQMRDVALKVLDERQADQVFTVDLSGKSSMADYLIIASGRASRQLSAIAHYLREAFEKLGLRNIRVEGLADANWVLVDAGDVIVHLFRPEVREYYNLESIWGAKKTAAEAEE